MFAEELARLRVGRAGGRASARTSASPPRRCGSSAPRSRSSASWRPAIRGERIAALGITEPGAGSDVAGIRTQAKRVDGGYLVNGSKTFITNGVRADFVVTAVKTTEEGGHQGLSFLLIERDMEGFTVSKKLEKIGWQASDTGELAFQDVFVPEENLLGEENKGFYLIMANFQWERLLMALGAVGSMRLVIERTRGLRAGAGGFRQADRPLPGDPPQGRGDGGEAGDGARASPTTRCASSHEGHDAIREVTMAKLQSQRAAFDVADESLQIHGGAGYMKEYEIERVARDLRLGPIGGGTDEIMKEILGKQMGL